MLKLAKQLSMIYQIIKNITFTKLLLKEPRKLKFKDYQDLVGLKDSPLQDIQEIDF